MTKMKTLSKSGNSVALVLDKDMLEAAGLEAGSTVEINIVDGIISVGKARDKKRAAVRDEILSRIEKRYGAVFKKLAE